MMRQRICTEYWEKPIPLRQFDWTATFDGYDAGDPVGHGETKEEAIANLMADADDGREPIMWVELDQLQSATEIRDFLAKAGVKGVRDSVSSCPLAMATGWDVDGDHRYLDGECIQLTFAEQMFVTAFDEDHYPELVAGVLMEDSD